MSTLHLTGVTRHFGALTVVDGIDLAVADGELLALLGPSGSGKTTLLRLIAGFETLDAGRIAIDQDDVTATDALQRRCGMVFQHYALFPHLSVAENVAYGLVSTGMRPAERSARVAEALAMVDLSGLEHRAVTALSGGQQQRVALARALAPRPRLLLLDEPLSNLDPSLRERTRDELRDLVRRLGITTILVTHEQDEAFALADRVALLHRGHLEQVDTPAMLYREPASAFVAGFVGRAARLVGIRSAEGTVVAGGVAWTVPGQHQGEGPVTLMVRPEALRVDPEGTMGGTITGALFTGAQSRYMVTLPAGDAVEVYAAHGLSVGAAVQLAQTGAGIHLFPVAP